jgi:hypothetical protein
MGIEKRDTGMNLKRIVYNILMEFNGTFRNRITFLLLFFIPAIFYLIATYTTSEIPILIKLASAPGEKVVLLKPRELGLIYIGLAATGFIASFIALNIMQRDNQVIKRQILCGYSIPELLLSKLIMILGIVVVLGIYTAVLGSILMKSRDISGVVWGYILSGYVYGSFGLLTGAVFKKELEGILVIVLLANLDLGWLQNPIFYSASPNKLIIKFLPGFNASQVAVISAFTDFSTDSQVIYSLIYGSVFLILSMIIFGIKMRTYNMHT